ncbi:12140_t:CDS:2, partial [Entrophospora sp. SA101]
VLAILSALLVSPPESNITIFSDSETTIKFFDRLIIKNEYISTRRLVKENNYLLWGIIQDTVAELKQKIQIKKVKAHNVKQIKEINHLAPGNMFDEKTYWRIYQDKNQITFIDIIKGIIPKDLYDHMKCYIRKEEKIKKIL